MLAEAVAVAGQPERDEALIRERLAVFRAYVTDNLGSGFTQMPNEVRHDPTLSRAAKDVYEHLLSYMWEGEIFCWPSQQTMAEKLGKGCKLRTVNRAIKELHERCYIEKVRLGLGRTNRYFINPLSFVSSFKRPGRGKGKEALLQVTDPVRQVTIADLPPHDVLSGIRQIGTSKDAENAGPEPQNVRTIHTKTIEYTTDSNSGDLKRLRRRNS